MGYVVTVQEVSKTYRLGKLSVTALAGVSLRVAAGEFLAVAGPSGSGKTTLLNLIGCLDTPSAGEIAVDGEPVTRLSPGRRADLRARKLDFVFQTFNLIPVLTAWENVEYPLLIHRRGGDVATRVRVEIVGQATDPDNGLAQIAAPPVDVLILDIHMPGLNGFQVVERVPAGPLVIFTTAHDQHAVRAFEVNAIDYLLKPVERERLDRALDGVTQRRTEPAGADLRGALERLARDLRAAPFLDHVVSRVRDRVQLIPVGDVTHLLARDRATFAVTAGAEHMLDMTLAELERRLDPARFFRIHRAIVVNLAWIGQLQADDGGHLIAGLKDARHTELPVSRDRVRALKERLRLV